VFSTLSPGDRFVCGISAGVTLCWGENANAFGNMSNAIVGIFSAHGASTVGGAEPYACGLNENGGALCWGGAIRGLRSTSSVARALDDKLSFQKIAPGAQHVCALTRDGYLYCGGGNYAGQVGDGTRIDRASLTLIEGN
jgi:hypothetical protein